MKLHYFYNSSTLIQKLLSRKLQITERPGPLESLLSKSFEVLKIISSYSVKVKPMYEAPIFSTSLCIDT